MEKEYRVIWEIDITASSHREAAFKAREIQLDPASQATFFNVRDENGLEIEIDTFNKRKYEIILAYPSVAQTEKEIQVYIDIVFTDSRDKALAMAKKHAAIDNDYIYKPEDFALIHICGD